jgi:hypothetical protein
MPAFSVVLTDGTVVGGADSLEAAASLAGGLYARAATPLRILDESDAEVGFVGDSSPPEQPATPLYLSAQADAEELGLVHFTLQGASADATLDYGDGTLKTETETTFDHSYAEPGTYRVLANTPDQYAETYVTVSEPESGPLAIFTLDPNTAANDVRQLQVTINGQGFEPGASVQFGDDTLVGVLLDPGTIGFEFDPSGYGVQSYPVTVRNPSGGTSNEVSFTLTATLPPTSIEEP